MLSVIILSVFMLSVIILNVFILGVIIPSVVPVHGIMDLIATLSINDNQHNVNWHKYFMHYAECCIWFYAECHYAVIMLSAVKQNAVILSLC